MVKKMIKKRKIIVLLILIFILLLTGCGKNKKDEDTNNKVIQELDYLDTKIVNILNKLNNITLRNYNLSKEEIQKEENSSNSMPEGNKDNNTNEQKESDGQSNNSSKTEETNITVTSMEPKNILSIDETNIDWNMIKQEIEIINETWSIVLLDLSYLNVDNNDILNFSSVLNDTLLSIKDENKVNTLVNTAKLYSFIPIFEKQLKDNKEIQIIKQVKSHLLNAYSNVEQNNWVDIEKNISLSEETFKNIIGNSEYMKNKEYKVNKTYVLLKELQNSLKYKDKNIFYLKYKNLIESINML